MSAFAFKPAITAYLSELAAHNAPDWFERHHARYLDEVEAPLSRFVEALAPRLKAVAPLIDLDPEPKGNSIVPLTRTGAAFEMGKPYKSYVSCHFRHRGGYGLRAPSFYFQLHPGMMILGAGVWHLDRAGLEAIKKAILEDQEGWQAVRDRMQMGMAPGGMALPMQGKNAFFLVRHGPEAAFSGDFLDRVAAFYEASTPVMRFLASALGQPFQLNG